MTLSYCAVSILIYIITYEIDNWSDVCKSHSLNNLMQDLIIVIRNWKAGKVRIFINIRSFKPIIDILTTSNHFCCQLWSCWTLAHFTSTQSESTQNAIESNYRNKPCFSSCFKFNHL